MKIIFRAALATAILLASAACGTSSPAASTGKPSATPAALTCGTTFGNGDVVSSDITALVRDQESQNKALEENWVGVTDGSLTSQGQDLQAAVTDFTPYTKGTSQLA